MRLLLIALFVTAFPAQSFAMDEFGARFSASAPSALSETKEEAAALKSPEETLSEIAPAAGEEESGEIGEDAAEMDVQASDNADAAPSQSE